MIRIGIDLGGTNIAVGAVDDGHAIVSRVSVPTLAYRPAAEVVGDMGDAVEAALAKAGLSIHQHEAEHHLPQHRHRLAGYLQLRRGRGGAGL